MLDPIGVLSPRNAYLASLAWTSATVWPAGFYDEGHWGVAARPRHVRDLAEPSFVLNERSIKAFVDGMFRLHYSTVLYETEFDGGKAERVDIVFAKNIGAFNETTGLFDPLTSRATWLVYSNYGQSPAEREPVEALYAHEWTNPRPERGLTAVRLIPSDEARKTGLILLGITYVP